MARLAYSVTISSDEEICRGCLHTRDGRIEPKVGSSLRCPVQRVHIQAPLGMQWRLCARSQEVTSKGKGKGKAGAPSKKQNQIHPSSLVPWTIQVMRGPGVGPLHARV